MANIVDILTIQPTVVSRDLQGKFLLVYGMPKKIGPLLSN